MTEFWLFSLAFVEIAKTRTGEYRLPPSGSDERGWCVKLLS